MATILGLHHKHVKLVKPLHHLFLRVPSENIYDLPICRTQEQKAKLQCLASVMPKSEMPSGDKNGGVSKEKKSKNLAVLAKTPRLKCFFFQQSF